MSAGSSGLVGRLWSESQAASWMQSRIGSVAPVVPEPKGKESEMQVQGPKWLVPLGPPTVQADGFLLVVIGLALRDKAVEGLDNGAGTRAVIHKDRRAAHPGLQLVHRKRHVLRVVLFGGKKKKIERMKSGPGWEMAAHRDGPC